MDVQRSPHAALNLEGRWPKALKIERVLARYLTAEREPRRLLEVGTGSGAIAHYFAERAATAFRVEAVDVLDQRQVLEGYRFTLVGGVALPFESGAFDVTISNHVIEHVGAEDSQREHLKEMHRVLAPRGFGYLATPNRWQLVEPHFHLPFLSWLPARWRDAYVRWAGRGSVYDCRPLRLKELERLLDEAGFGFENAGVLALREVISIEHSKSWIGTIFRMVPDWFLFMFRRINPTHVYVIWSKNARGDEVAG